MVVIRPIRVVVVEGDEVVSNTLFLLCFAVVMVAVLFLVYFSRDFCDVWSDWLDNSRSNCLDRAILDVC